MAPYGQGLRTFARAGPSSASRRSPHGLHRCQEYPRSIPKSWESQLDDGECTVLEYRLRGDERLRERRTRFLDLNPNLRKSSIVCEAVPLQTENRKTISKSFETYRERLHYIGTTSLTSTHSCAPVSRHLHSHDALYPATSPLDQPMLHSTCDRRSKNIAKSTGFISTF